MPKDIEKAINEMPRDAEVIDLLKKVSGEGPLPGAITAKPRIAYSDPNRHPFRVQIGTRSDRNRHLFRRKSATLFRVS
jgi:hypothetical protein